MWETFAKRNFNRNNFISNIHKLSFHPYKSTKKTPSRDLKEISKLEFINAIKSNKNFEHWMRQDGVLKRNKKKSKSGKKGNSIDIKRRRKENSYLYNESEIPSLEKCSSTWSSEQSDGSASRCRCVCDYIISWCNET